MGELSHRFANGQSVWNSQHSIDVGGGIGVVVDEVVGDHGNSPLETTSLFVGDLLPEVDEDLLREIFDPIGSISSIHVCRDVITGHSLGYAYIHYDHASDAEQALKQKNFTDIKGKPCWIMRSKSKQSMILIKNLSPRVDNVQLHNIFSKFGKILSCNVESDKDTGTSKGYGYVRFETSEAAEESIKSTNGSILDGMAVHVGIVMKREVLSELSETSLKNNQVLDPEHVSRRLISSQGFSSAPHPNESQGSSSRRRKLSYDSYSDIVRESEYQARNLHPFISKSENLEKLDRFNNSLQNKILEENATTSTMPQISKTEDSINSLPNFEEYDDIGISDQISEEQKIKALGAFQRRAVAHKGLKMSSGDNMGNIPIQKSVPKERNSIHTSKSSNEPNKVSSITEENNYTALDLFNDRLYAKLADEHISSTAKAKELDKNKNVLSLSTTSDSTNKTPPTGTVKSTAPFDYLDKRLAAKVENANHCFPKAISTEPTPESGEESASRLTSSSLGKSTSSSMEEIKSSEVIDVFRNRMNKKLEISSMTGSSSNNGQGGDGVLRPTPSAVSNSKASSKQNEIASKMDPFQTMIDAKLAKENGVGATSIHPKNPASVSLVSSGVSGDHFLKDEATSSTLDRYNERINSKSGNKNVDGNGSLNSSLLDSVPSDAPRAHAITLAKKETAMDRFEARLNTKLSKSINLDEALSDETVSITLEGQIKAKQRAVVSDTFNDKVKEKLLKETGSVSKMDSQHSQHSKSVTTKPNNAINGSTSKSSAFDEINAEPFHSKILAKSGKVAEAICDQEAKSSRNRQKIASLENHNDRIKEKISKGNSTLAEDSQHINVSETTLRPPNENVSERVARVEIIEDKGPLHHGAMVHFSDDSIRAKITASRNAPAANSDVRESKGEVQNPQMDSICNVSITAGDSQHINVSESALRPLNENESERAGRVEIVEDQGPLHHGAMVHSNDDSMRAKIIANSHVASANSEEKEDDEQNPSMNSSRAVHVEEPIFYNTSHNSIETFKSNGSSAIHRSSNATTIKSHSSEQLNVGTQEFTPEGLAVARPVSFSTRDDPEAGNIHAAIEYDPDAKIPVYESKKFVVGTVLALVSIAVIVSVSTVRATESRQETVTAEVFLTTNPSRSPTTAPTTSRETAGIREFIEATVLQRNATFEEMSDDDHRRNALDWLLNVDPMQLGLDADNLSQRYVLALFAYSLDSLSWTNCGDHMMYDSATVSCKIVADDFSTDMTTQTVDEYSAVWLSSAHECAWYGVLCYDDVVLGLELGHNNLIGEIPPEISELAMVEKIDLGGNCLYSSIPFELGKFPRLRHLDLGSNGLSGFIPNEIFDLNALTHLDLSWNYGYYNTCNRTDGTSVTTVYSMGNPVNGDNPGLMGDILGSRIGKLHNLETLMLWFNSFSGSISSDISSLSNLVVLDASYNLLKGSIPSEMAYLQNLKQLSLATNEIAGNLPSNIGNITSLETLLLSQTAMEGEIPDSLYSRG